MTEFWEVGVTNKAELEKKLSEEAMSAAAHELHES